MSSPMDFITECYYKESLDTIKQVFGTLNKNTVTMEELLEGFQNMYRPSQMINSNKEINQKKVSKPKIKRVQKELIEEERCIATKKDNTQCKGKKLASGSNPQLCSLHNNALSKRKVSIKPKEYTEKVTCSYVFTKGVNKGDKCSKSPTKNDDKCRLHSELELEIDSNTSHTSSSKKSKIITKKPELLDEYVEPEFEDDLGLNYSENETEEVYENEEIFD